MQDLNPLQLISVIELFIATAISLILTVFISKKYQEKPNRVTFVFALNFLLVGVALTCVAVDRILLTFLLDPNPGLIFHNIAILVSLGVILLLDMFAFEMTYPKQVNKLSIIFGILLIAAGIILLLNQPQLGAEQEIIYSDQLLYLILPFLIPPMLLPTFVFFYYAFKVREESIPKSNRALVMGFAAIVVSIGYIFEVMGITGITVIFVRLMFVIYVFLMYIAFTLPKWFQNIIGSEQP